MKKNNLFVLFLVVFFIFSPTCLYAREKPYELNRLLKRLASSEVTSMQKSDFIENYKGKAVMGYGVVKDVLRSYASEKEAVVYLKKTYKGRKYEIVLTVGREIAERLKKKRAVTFRGKLVGASFDTIRFEDVKIIEKPWWFPF